MKDEVFNKLILQLKVGCGSLPALTGHHLSKEQFDEICSILQRRKEMIDRYINCNVRCRLIKLTDEN